MTLEVASVKVYDSSTRPPKDGDELYILNRRLYSNSIEFGKIELTWDNEEGTQIVYSGEETVEELEELKSQGFKLLTCLTFENRGGYGLPDKFRYVLVSDLFAGLDDELEEENEP